MTALPYDEWHDTLEPLHMRTQVIGKIQLELAAPVNHWPRIAQHVTARGLSTGLPLESAWSAAADAGGWNRTELEAH